MSVQLVGETRLGNRVVFGLIGALVVALALGLWTGGLFGEVSPVYAFPGTHPANSACPGGDLTATSAITVTHHTSPSYLGTSTVVEPDTGESWRIDASYYPAGNPPGETIYTAYADVDWNGSSWVLSNVTLPIGGIVGVGICQGATCDAGMGTVHSWEYKLIVNATMNMGGANPHLDHVTYTTTSVDDSYTVEDPTETYGNCYTNAAVSPTSQTFGATDYQADWGSGPRCPYNCNTPGTTVTLTYD